MKNRPVGFLLSFLFIWLFTTVASSQSYWEQLPAPSGGHPDHIVEQPNGLLFANFGDTLIYRSANQGQQWEEAFHLPYKNIHSTYGLGKITFGQDGILYREQFLKSTSQDLYPYYRTIRSSDNGATWQTLLDSSVVYGITSTTHGILMGLTLNITQDTAFIMRSTDNGSNWTVEFTTDQINFPNVKYHDNFHLQAVENGGIVCISVVNDRCLFSFDEGITWRMESQMPDNVYYAPVFTKSKTYLVNNNTLGGRLYRIDSTGTTILNVGYGSNAHANALLLRNDGSILYETIDPLLVSTDDGMTWQILSQNLTYKIFPLPVQTQAGIIFANSDHDLTRSEDNGLKWAFSATNFPFGQIQSLQVLSPDTLIAQSNGELFTTVDAGIHWTPLFSEPQTEYIHFDGQNTVVTKKREIYTYHDIRVMYSSDFGKHFQNISPPGVVQNNLTGWGLYYDENMQVVYVNVENGIARSADKGVTWEHISVPRTSSFTRHPSGTLFICSKYNGLYSSEDGGHNWSYLNTGLSFYTINASTTGDLLALCSDGYYKSMDKGITWFKMLDSEPTIYSGSFDSYTGTVFENIQHHYFFLHFNFVDAIITRSIDEGYSHFNLPLQAPNAKCLFLTIGENDQKLYSIYENKQGMNVLARTASSTAIGAVIKGTVTRETDDNCDTYELQNPLKNWIVNAIGANSWYVNTDSAGRYSMFVDTGAYILTVKPPISLFWQKCADSIPIFLPNILDTVTQRFSIKSIANCPYMFVDLAVPYLDLGFENEAHLTYSNQGSVTANNAWVDVTIDSKLILKSPNFPYDSLGNHVYRFHLGSVESATEGSLYFTLKADPDSVQIGETHCISAHIHPDSVCVPVPAWSGAEIVVDARCQQDTAVQFEITNIGDQQTQTLHYIVIEDDVVMKHGFETYAPHETKTLQFTAGGHTWRFETQQEPGHPFSHLASATIEGCNGIVSAGLVNLFDLDNGIPSQDVECIEVRASHDPNDKKGLPEGYGTDHLIEPHTPIAYLIDFQNTGTAPAHLVVIRDTLDAWLDPATLQMGASSHPYTWKLEGQGVLVISYTGINLPDSSSNPPASQGFISYKINQKTNVPLGTIIHNTASIYFDFNGSVVTNQTFHKIGHNFIKQITLTKTLENQPMKVRVIPNPVVEEAQLILDGLSDGDFVFHLTDAAGRELQQQSFHGNAFQFQRNQLSASLYFFQITTPSGKPVASGKILIQ
jgi:hypothetical protein